MLIPSTIISRTRKGMLLATAGVLSLASLSTVTQSVASAEDEVASVETTRVSGANRYETAIEVAKFISDNDLTSVEKVIVASGENFPDGLTASGLAGVLSHCPEEEEEEDVEILTSAEGGCSDTVILLTPKNEAPSAVLSAVTATGVNPDDIIVVGGPEAVSDAVVESLASAAGWNGEGDNPVLRIYGENRYGTASEIAKWTSENFELKLSHSRLLLSTGLNFPDSLSAGPVAYSCGKHIALTQTDILSDEASDIIADLGAVFVDILGGPVAVSEDVEDDLKDDGKFVVRHGGLDRYETAVEIASLYKACSEMPMETVILVSGENFPDALSAATVSRLGAPILLVKKDVLPESTKAWLEANANDIKNIVAIGGESVISNDVIAEAEQAVEDSSTVVPTLPTPIDLGVEEGDSSITLSWTDDGDDSTVDSYEIEMGSPVGAFSPVIIDGVESSPHVIDDLTNGTEYSFRVRSVDAEGGRSPWSGIWRRAVPHTVPGAPTDLDVNTSDENLVLSWLAPVNNGGKPITGYEAEASTTEDFAVVAESKNVEGSELTATFVEADASAGLYFRVRAVNAAGEGSWSEVFSHNIPEE